MSRLRRTLAVAALAAFAAACQLIAGIKDHRFQVDEAPAPEAGPADTAAPPPPDPCAHVTLPPRPDAAFDEAAGTYIVALRTIDFSGADDAGAPLGFDLDGVCTCDTDPATAHQGASACTPPGALPCDFEGGVDNALYNPFRSAAGFLGPLGNGAALLGDQAECGRETLLLVVTDYNGKADDSLVKVGLIPSYGIRQPHDAGEIPDSACTSTPGPPYPAKWDGTDVWSFAEGTAVRRGEILVPLISTPDAYVTGYRLVVPPVRAVTLFLGTVSLEVSSPAVVATLVGVDPSGRDVAPGAPAASFRIAEGTLGGRIGIAAFLSAIGQLRVKGGNIVCQTPLIGDVVRNQLCASRDILSDPVRDFQPPGAPPFACDAVSTAVRFAGQAARVGDSFSPDGGKSPCDPSWPVCP